MIPARRWRPGGLVDLVFAIDLRGVRRRGGSDKAPLCDVDDHANPSCFAPHVVFRAGSLSRHARHLSLPGIDRMRIVCPAAASRRPGGYGLGISVPTQRRPSCGPHLSASALPVSEQTRMQLRTPRIDFPITSRRRQTPLLVRRRLIEMGPKSGVDDRILKPRDIWSDSEAYGAAFYREIRFPRTR